MTSQSPDVVVIGGGVIGCSIAFHLAKSGVRTTLLERGRLGSEASNAASGILTVSPGDHPYFRLGRESLAMFHQLAPELKETGGVDMELVQCGELNLALTEDEALEYRSMSQRFAALGGGARWLDQKEAHEVEPELSPSVLGAMHLPETCRVNNQRLSEAFGKAAMRLGAAVSQGAEVVGLLRNGGRVTGVRLLDRDIHAGDVILAAGSWCRVIADWVGLKVPVRPVRGQNLNLQPAGRGIRSVVHGSWGLLAPRNDGSLMVGATVEEAGYDCRVTAGGVQAITNVAAMLVPSLRDATLNWAVAGLRPGSPDDMPLIGPLPGIQGLSLASGHFRNGILLSPVTGKLMADYITGGGDREMLAAFSPGRFIR